MCNINVHLISWDKVSIGARAKYRVIKEMEEGKQGRWLYLEGVTGVENERVKYFSTTTVDIELPVQDGRSIPLGGNIS